MHSSDVMYFFMKFCLVHESVYEICIVGATLYNFVYLQLENLC